MHRLFTFLKKHEGHSVLRFSAKVVRIIFIFLAFAMAIYSIIVGAVIGEVGVILLSILLSVVVFFVMLFLGIFVEAILISFSNIAENNFEELVKKGKGEDPQEVNPLSRKQNANFKILAKLNELKASGAITAEEYEQKKKELLEKV